MTVPAEAARPTDSSMLQSRMDALLARALPPVTGTSTLLLKAIRGGTLSFQSMSNQLKNDPVLALNLLSRANLAIRSDEGLVKTLSQAISLLGETFLIGLLEKTPKPERPDTPATRCYQRVISGSFFAAHLTGELSRRRLAGREEELFWSSLFWSVPFWYLARFATEAFEAAMTPPNLPWAERNRRFAEATGYTLDDFWHHAQGRLQLPDLIQSAYAEPRGERRRTLARFLKGCEGSGRQPLPEGDRELRLLLSRPQELLQLCNQASWYAHHGWQNDAFLQTCRLLAAATDLTLREVVHLSHQTAVNSLRLHPLSVGLPLVASLLVDPGQKPVTAPEPMQTLEPAPAPTPVPEPVAAPIVEPEIEPVVEPIVEAVVEQPLPEPMPEPEPEPVIETLEPAPPEPIEEAMTAPEPEVEPEPAMEAPPAPEPEPIIEHAPPKAATPEDNPILERKPRLPVPPPRDDTMVVRKPKLPIPEIPSRRGDRQLFNQLCETMLRDAGAFRDMAHVMETFNRALISGLGMQTSLVLLVNQQATAVKTYFAQGTQDRPGLDQLAIDTSSSILLQKLLQKQAGLWVRPENIARLKDQLPNALMNQTRTLDFFIMSAFVKTRPVALLYADGGPGKTYLTDFEYESFKHACSGVTHVLYYLAVQKAKNRKP